MERVRRFEDLIAWQKSRVLVQSIYRVSRSGELADDYRFARQLQSAAVAVMSNIAEGFERGGGGEFHQFLTVAKASCAEVRSLLYVGLDVKYLGREQFQLLMEQAREVARILGGLRKAVAAQRTMKGAARA